MPGNDFEFKVDGVCSLLPDKSVIIECIVKRYRVAGAPENGKRLYQLFFHRLRGDQTLANSVSTLKAVLNEVDMDISLEKIQAQAERYPFRGAHFFFVFIQDQKRRHEQTQKETKEKKMKSPRQTKETCRSIR